MVHRYVAGEWVVSCAMLEGAAFFNLVAYMIEGQVYSLVIALVLWVAMLLKFPTVGRVAEWLEQNHRRANEARAFES